MQSWHFAIAGARSATHCETKEEYGMKAIEISRTGRTGGFANQGNCQCPTRATGRSWSRFMRQGSTVRIFCSARAAIRRRRARPLTPGLEIAGEVMHRRGRTRYKIGDKVCALVPGGGYAEYCVVAEDNALPLPQGFSLIEAAAIPETYFTVWTNVFERGRLQPGETISGTWWHERHWHHRDPAGKSFRVATLLSLPAVMRNARHACALGADVAINYRTQDFVAVMKEQRHRARCDS